MSSNGKSSSGKSLFVMSRQFRWAPGVVIVTKDEKTEGVEHDLWAAVVCHGEEGIVVRNVARRATASREWHPSKVRKRLSAPENRRIVAVLDIVRWPGLIAPQMLSVLTDAFIRLQAEHEAKGREGVGREHMLAAKLAQLDPEQLAAIEAILNRS